MLKSYLIENELLDVARFVFKGFERVKVFLKSIQQLTI